MVLILFIAAMITSCRSHWDYILNTETLLAVSYHHAIGNRLPPHSVPVKCFLSGVTVLSSERILLVLKNPLFGGYHLFLRFPVLPAIFYLNKPFICCIILPYLTFLWHFIFIFCLLIFHDIRPCTIWKKIILDDVIHPKRVTILLYLIRVFTAHHLCHVKHS